MEFNGSNSSGFSGNPNGMRYCELDTDHDSISIGLDEGWWSITEDDKWSACARFLSYSSDKAKRGFPRKLWGLSVRCIKNN